MTDKFKSELLEEIKEDELREVTRGDGNGAVTFILAKEYGFCWGVERSIELAWAARDAYPDKKMHITNEARARAAAGRARASSLARAGTARMPSQRAACVPRGADRSSSTTRA
jgi:hypothetical protein